MAQRKRPSSAWLLCFVGLTFLVSRQVKSSSPMLVISPMAWDFGRIEDSHPVEHVFSLVNEGQAVLAVSSVSTSCPCTSAAISSQTISPGSTAELTVSYDPRGKVGVFKDFVIIAANDPVRPLQRIRISGEVVVESQETVEPAGNTVEAADSQGNGQISSVHSENRESSYPARQDRSNNSLRNAPLASVEKGIRESDSSGPQPVEVLFFYSPHCPDCLEIKNAFLTRLQKKRGRSLAVKYYDVTRDEDYAVLLAMEKGLGQKIDKTPPLAIVGRSVLAGAAAIKKRLEGEIEKQRGIPTPPAKGRFSAEERFKDLGLLAVAAGGLADGINPCAFTTLVFLLSYLALVGRKGKVLLLAGSAFAGGVFLAYFLVGLGLLEILSRVPWFALAGRVLTLIVAGAAGVFGLLSLHDLLRTRRCQAAEAKLQLGERLKRRIHAVIRERVRGRFVAAPSFAAGFLVALIEFPCTGQVYFPIVLVLRRIAPLRAQALLYLLLYNLLFILPLLAVFGLACWGLASERLAAAVRRNLGWAKLLLAIVFLSLGALLFLFAM